jgi:hypothetical protein
MTTAEGRYRALCTLRDWRHPELHPGLSATQRGAVLPDTGGTLYVRVSQFGAHVRGMAGRPVPWGTLHSRMLEVGWRYPTELQQRQARGTGKVKLHVYPIPQGWDDGEVSA